MWVDASQLSDFYKSPLGTLVHQSVSLCLEKFSKPLTSEEVLVAYGYGVPYVDKTLGQTNRTLCLMPSFLGALAWPPEGPNLTCLCEGTLIPLPSRSVHRLFMIHALELCRDAEALLQEAWRVLVEGGELILVVPNRRGLWARSVTTPFGQGHPYSGRQLFALVESQDFVPLGTPTYCLFHPPFNTTLLQSERTLRWVETIGRRWVKKIGGLVFLRAEKRLVACLREKKIGLGPRVLTQPILSERTLSQNSKRASLKSIL